MSAMRVVIFGTGGAGGYFGAQLARAGEDGIFVARGKNLIQITTREQGIEKPGEKMVIRPAKATDEPVKVKNPDVFLLGVKAWQVREGAKAIRSMMGPNTFLIERAHV